MSDDTTAPVTDDLATVARWAEVNDGPGSQIQQVQAAVRRLLGIAKVAISVRSEHEAQLAGRWRDATRRAELAETRVERLEEALRDAYAERDQQFERKVAALRERDEAKQQLAEAQRTIAAHERHINDTFETNRRDLQKVRDQRDEAQDERDALKAAIYDTRIAHIRTVHPSRIIVDDCGECRAFVALGLATPAKPDDLDELCRRLAALDAPTGTP